jgi:hypothetical protein
MLRASDTTDAQWRLGGGQSRPPTWADRVPIASSPLVQEYATEGQSMILNQRVEKESFARIAAGDKRDLRLAARAVHAGDTMILE